jgi:hypothetical protein
MYDFVIRGATMFDGSGAPPQLVDVAVEGSFIAEIGDLAGAARREIDATNLALAPGFIDVHTHDDFAVLLYPEMAFKVLGGVTTCVVATAGWVRLRGRRPRSWHEHSIRTTRSPSTRASRATSLTGPRAQRLQTSLRWPDMEPFDWPSWELTTASRQAPK